MSQNTAKGTLAVCSQEAVSLYSQLDSNLPTYQRPEHSEKHLHNHKRRPVRLIRDSVHVRQKLARIVWDGKVLAEEAV
jgi:hypothetical protein